MSFRLFIWYCLVGGAWCGFVGWFLGAVLAPSVPAGNQAYFPPVLRASIQAMLLGFAVAFGLSFLDAVFNVSLRQFGKVAARVFAAVIVGVFGGLFGGFLGGSAYFWLNWSPVLLISWVFVGFLVGISISFFQLFASLALRKDFSGSIKKFIKCVVGGTLGGIIGGVIFLILQFAAGFVFRDKDLNALWAPPALGFIAIGACTGLLVGLAQVILKEAWIRVEAGFRPGRELILMKEKTSIGRGEGSDIGLYGDSGVEKAHASIVLDGGRYYLELAQTVSETFVNDMKVDGRTALKAGDLIRVGKSVLRFNERAKRKD